MKEWIRMKRKIIQIHEDKCNGCGVCVTACHEGAIEIIDGKAKLVSDTYCDGLGNCLPGCPTDAIEIIEREADEFDEVAVEKRMKELAMKEQAKKEAAERKPMACGCPGTAARALERKPVAQVAAKPVAEDRNNEPLTSELRQWPVQLNLINPNAPYLDNANLLVAADCTAYAYANFHREFIKDHITVIGCPKLDDVQYYKEKLAEMLRSNNIKSITVVRMQVPCCGGIVSAVKSAMLESQVILPYREVIISPDGNII